jgi:hypothetical protein
MWFHTPMAATSRSAHAHELVLHTTIWSADLPQYHHSLASLLLQHVAASSDMQSEGNRISQQVIAVEATQELEHCRRCLVTAMDGVLSKLRTAHVGSCKLLTIVLDCHGYVLTAAHS